MRDPDDATDEVLAGRVAKGDREALGRLLRRNLRPVHSVAASFLDEPADIEDAVQDTFVKAISRISKYDPGRPFSPWLYQIARNVARDRLAERRRERTGPFTDGMRDAAATSPDSVVERSEIRRRVDAAIAHLPEQQRTAFRLHDVDGYGTADTARIMGLSEGTIRSHLHHARRALRALLAGSDARPHETEESRNVGR